MRTGRVFVCIFFAMVLHSSYVLFGSTSQSNVDSKTVYFEGHGPAPLVNRFRSFLGIALQDTDFKLVTDRAAADFNVTAKITEKTEYEKLYEYAYQVDATGQDHRTGPITFSGWTRRSADVGNDVDEYALSEFAAGISRSFPGAGTIYVTPFKTNTGHDLTERLKAQLGQARYKVVARPDLAEIVVNKVSLKTCIAPISVTAQEVRVVVVNRSNARGEFNGTRELVKSVGPPLAPDFQECKQKAREHLGNQSQDEFWRLAQAASEFMQK